MAPTSLHSFPALRIAVLFAAGILFGQQSPEWVPLLFLLSLLLVCTLVAISFVLPLVRLFPLPHVVPALVCFFLGILGTTFNPEGVRVLPSIIGNKPVILKAVVSAQPGRNGERIRFIAEGSSLIVDSAVIPFPHRVLVTVKVPESRNYPEYGSTVLLRGSVFKPRAARNPGEFDQRRYYLANGIEWMFSVNGRHGVYVLERGGGSWVMREVVLPVRTYVLQEIDRGIGGQEGEYLKGVLLGERGGLLPAVREAFTAAGVAHILAVSGGNVAVVVAFIYFLAELLRFPRRARAVAGCAGILFYMLLVGYQPPVVRATMMAMVMILGALLEERSNPVNSLGVSALAILAIDPRQLSDVGFQLSFLAVFSIIILYPILDGWLVRIVPGSGVASRVMLWLLRVCAVSLVAGLGTLPLTACYFGRVSIIGVLTNIVVVPASGFSLLLGFLAVPVSVFSPWIADTYHILNQWILWLTLELTVRAGNLPVASMDTMRFTPVDGLPFYGILLLLFTCGRRAVRNKMMILLLVALNLWIFLPEDPSVAGTRRLRISFIDVGQGDAALVEFPDGRTILIDAGPWSAAFDSGSKIVVPFLKRRGVTRIDLLVATHPHNDHIGGIPAVLKMFDVVHVVHCGRASESAVYRAYQSFVEEEQCRLTAAEMGMGVDGFSGARLYLLAPERGLRADNLNNSSVVFKLVYGMVGILFMGDAESESESRISERYGGFLKASILKVGHHGSKTSSTDVFRALADPDIAVVSVGTPNRYRHPSSDILARFEEGGATVLRTDEEGAIVFETDGTTLERIVWNGE